MNKGTPIREEWDFSSSRVPDIELRMCAMWEVARDRPDVLEKVPRANEYQGEEFFGSLKKIFFVWHELGFGKTAIQDTPWQNLPTKIRRAYAIYEKDFPLSRYVSKGAKAEEELRQEPAEVKGYPVAFSFCDEIDEQVFQRDADLGYYIEHLKVNWRYSDAELKEAFGEILKLMRPPDMPNPARKGAGSELRRYRSGLKAIGARRLLRSMSWLDAADHTADVLGDALYKGDQASWSHAEADAAQFCRVTLPV